MTSAVKNIFIVCFGCLVWVQCTSSTSEQKPDKPMVYEGMSSQELERVLGEPIQKDSVSSIYLPEQNKSVAVEKWVYDKRTVLIINDTIKVPNVK